QGLHTLPATCRRLRGLRHRSPSAGARPLSYAFDDGRITQTMRATAAVGVLEVVSHSRWPCNSNSVCLDPCHLPRPEARSTDFGLSAGILAAGPAEPAYSLEASGVTGIVRRRRPLPCLCGPRPLPLGVA